MKNWIIGGIGILLTFLIIINFKSHSKIAYVDSIKLLSNYKGMKDAQVLVQRKSAEYQAKVDTLYNSLNKSVADFEKNKNTMSLTERKQKEENLMGKQQEYIRYKQAIEQKVKDEEAEQSRIAVAPVDKVIKEYGEKHGYSIIIGANSSGNVLYADEAINITEDILKILNK